MSSNVTVQQARSLDEFADWTDEVESRDDEISQRAIVGQSVSFGNDGKFRLRDKTELTKPLIVANCRRVLTKWGKEKRPVETVFLKAGEKIPDLEKRNAETPRSEWIEGFNHEPKGPWQAQHVVYMVDPVSIDQYTYPTATVGGGIAVRELIDRILWMRRFKGNAVYPIVQLTTRSMSIQRGTATRPRPHFEIVNWTKFETDEANVIPANDTRQLPLQPPAETVADVVEVRAPTATVAPNNAKKMQEVLAAIGGENVEPPTLKEETKDEIPW
jgi:hypothetical protein